MVTKVYGQSQRWSTAEKIKYWQKQKKLWRFLWVFIPFECFEWEYSMLLLDFKENSLRIGHCIEIDEGR